jgi:hypothetical protein
VDAQPSVSEALAALAAASAAGPVERPNG